MNCKISSKMLKMGILKIIIAVLLSLSGIFILIMLGHCVSVYSFFHGPPPSSEYTLGLISLTVCLVIALTTCAMAFFVIYFDLRSLTIVIFINGGFLLALVLSGTAVFNFRDPVPTSEKFRSYTSAYFKEYKKPPPFIDRIQRIMKGYCCGASGYADYLEDASAEFFDVPHTCCFTHLRRTDPNCGKHRWRYLYEFLGSIMTESMSRLEKDYEDIEDLQGVQRKLARGRAQDFIQSHIRQMFQDRVASIQKNLTADQIGKVQEEEFNQNGRGTNVGSAASNRIYNQAQAELDELKREIVSLVNVTFVPMGCWSLMDEIQTSKWKGFGRFREVRDRVRGIFQGLLATNIVNLILITASAIAFNYYYYFFTAAAFKSVQLGLEDEEKQQAGQRLSKRNYPEDETSDMESVPQSSKIETTELSEEEEKEDRAPLLKLSQSFTEDSEVEDRKKLMSLKGINISKKRSSKNETKGNYY